MYSYLLLNFSFVADVDHDSMMIYILGFQEIVELNATAITNADESNLRTSFS